MRVLTFDIDGNLVEDRDDRTVSWCVEQRLEMIRNECALAIEATGVRWMVEREVSGGKPVPQDVKDTCAALRAKSNTLEKQIADYAALATSDTDKATCDLIEAVNWH